MDRKNSDSSASSGSGDKPSSIDGNQSTSRMKIRIKVSKKADSQCKTSSPESVTSQIDQVGGASRHYSCKFCNLKFSSERSLGAHVKAHEKHSNYDFTDSDKMGLEDEKGRIKEGCRGERKRTLEETKKKNQQEPVCTLCKKTFPSLKSLFGHMRCHPERNWRGIQPPEKPVLAGKNERKMFKIFSNGETGKLPENVSSGSISNGLSGKNDRKMFKIFGNGETGKPLENVSSGSTSNGLSEKVKHSCSNGSARKSSESSSYQTDATITEASSKEHDHLSPLSKRDHLSPLSNWSVTGSRRRNRTIAENKNLQSNKFEGVFTSSKETEVAYNLLMLSESIPLSESKPPQRNSGEDEIISTRHDSKKRKLLLGVSSTNNREEEVKQEKAQDSVIGSEIPVSGDKKLPPERQGSHICTLCHKRFDSGQALGGHMRRHFDREKHQAKLKARHPQVELGRERKNGEGEVELGGEQKNGERMEFIDLNGVMPIEDEDLGFAFSMVEVVPDYGAYLSSRLKERSSFHDL
ncbi:protein suppressor of hairy wing [Amborella trichopoda]|uniref:C2H2-type domain-containing protein n=1 Tax=Amborella trichopoda TaxID=13333 RepID=U5DCA1_AMBTC|nr:protein suppressor of hairy wing [Amborella trichopoda]ERN19037.1 hypothetical protein AMTR_s00061p00070770 [Amborella trichopoda]|eukprot:XP_020531254.1 protein suppressor of hairy wing [Amborella trichopoda]